MSLAVVRSEKLVAEAGDSSGTSAVEAAVRIFDMHLCD
jgi:hypothetical protein